MILKAQQFLSNLNSDTILNTEILVQIVNVERFIFFERMGDNIFMRYHSDSVSKRIYTFLSLSK